MSNIVIHKRGNIRVEVLADSTDLNNHHRAMTFRLHYPRFIHSEFMTHRLFSRNASSSRAIPVGKMILQVEESPAMPIHWGVNQPGMQAKEEFQGVAQEAIKALWISASKVVCSIARVMESMKVHKQIVNRILEPFQMMNVIMTTTEMANFLHLRAHPDAQPEIQELALGIKEAIEASTPVSLSPGQWHLPFITVKVEDGEQKYFDSEGNALTQEEALMVSASCCAQVSYRKEDGSLEKARSIFDRLINSEPCHASPVEHQLKAMTGNLEPGVTHVDLDGTFWSGNSRGFIQYRKLIPGESVW